MNPPSLDIATAIPHRAPMLLVDRVLSISESSIACEKEFRADEFFLQGHYPGFPIVPGVILCECVAQAGAILLSTKVGQQPGVPVLTRLNDVKFKHMVRPGDVLEIQVTLDETVANAFYLTGQAKVDGKLAVRLSFACALADVGNVERSKKHV